jgi:hypothetical protein
MMSLRVHETYITWKYEVVFQCSDIETHWLIIRLEAHSFSEVVAHDCRLGTWKLKALPFEVKVALLCGNVSKLIGATWIEEGSWQW